MSPSTEGKPGSNPLRRHTHTSVECLAPNEAGCSTRAQHKDIHPPFCTGTTRRRRRRSETGGARWRPHPHTAPPPRVTIALEGAVEAMIAVEYKHVPFAPSPPLPSPPLPPLFRGAIMARWRPASPSPSTTRRRERDSTHARLRLLLPLPSSRHQWEKRGAHKNGGVGGIGPGPRPAGACSHRSSSSIRLQQSVRDGHGEGELHLRLPTQQSLFKETNPNDERGAGLQMHTVCTSLEYSTPTRLHAHAQLGMSSGVSVPGCARAWGSDLPTDPEFKVP